MLYQNNATKIRREVIIRLIELFNKDALATEANKIPFRMFPKDQQAMRCCIYKDRAVCRLRTIAALGWAAEDDSDDSYSLNQYAEDALRREHLEGPVMTVLDLACKGCVNNRYVITDVCQGCIARPCVVNCPKNAITVVNGRSIIDAEKCINCGKCQNVCPYNAVTRVSVPCEEACPVGAISKDKAGRANIDYDKCISCGRCMRSCPFGAVMERSQVIDVLSAIKKKRRVVAMIAPAIAGQFPGTLEQIAQGLTQIGFDSVVEVASGADITTVKEAEEFLERMEEGQPFMTTSCCPAYVESVERHLKELKPYVSDTRTPMHYTAENVKKNDTEAVAVFIGPCVAKRHEGFEDEFVDYVLTFEEVGAIFVANDIEICLNSGMELSHPPSRQARGFAVSGGVAAAVAACLPEGRDVKSLSINGLSKKELNKLRYFATSGKCDGNLIEVMACEGGCVAGAGAMAIPKVAAREVEKVCAESQCIKKLR